MGLALQMDIVLLASNLVYLVMHVSFWMRFRKLKVSTICRDVILNKVIISIFKYKRFGSMCAFIAKKCLPSDALLIRNS